MRAWVSTITTLVAVGAVAALLIVLTVAGAGARSVAAHPTPTPSPESTPTEKPKPSPPVAAEIVEIDFIDSATGFALLCTHPGGGQCQYWVAGTVDGAASWSRPVKVGRQVTTGESGHHLHFVDADDGFMYGNQEAYVTHDAGKTWHGTGLKFLEVVTVVGRTPWAWVVTYPCAKGSTPPCSYRAYLTSDGGRTWTRQVDLGNLSPRFAVPFGAGGLALSGDGGGDVFVIAPAAAQGRYAVGACPGETNTVYMATPDGTELWEMCTAAFPDNTPKTLFVSEDGSATWQKRSLPAGLGEQSDLVSTAPGVAVLVSSASPVESTSDGGRSWQTLGAAEGFEWIEFTSRYDAWAATGDGSIWLSADGGKTWTEATTPSLQG